MAQIPQPADDIASKYNDLLRRVENLENTNPLQSAVVDKGGIEIINGGSFQVIDPSTSRPVVYVGAFIGGGFGSTLARPNGSVALQVYNGFLAIRDGAANIVVSDDATGGVGIATPYIPAGVFQDITAPTSTTTSASFVGLQWADVYQQHPKLTCSVLVQAGASTPAEVRMTIAGSGLQVGATLSVPGGSFGVFTIPPAAWPAGQFAFGARLTLQLEARRVGGTGTVGLRSLGLWGVQS